MSEEAVTPNRNQNGKFVAIILLLLILLASMTYLWSGKKTDLQTCNDKSIELQATIDEMNEMMSGYLGGMTNDLTKDFESMLETYDALIKKDASQADSLNLQKDKIQTLLSELKSSKRRNSLSASEIAKLRRENETLRNIMIGYVKQIDELNTLNLQLESDLDQKTTELSSTQTERDQYKEASEASAEQVKKGSKLQAYNFSSTGLRMKINNTTEPTTKARNCVQVRSSFSIGENPISEAGNKVVYMQIIDPDGKTLQGRAGGTAEVEGSAVAYSDKKEINYQNKAIDLSIFYDFDGAEPVKGAYKVKIYCDGQLIGSDSFNLK